MAGKHAFASAALMVVIIAAANARSAPPLGKDPDWPCQQRLVPKLAAAAYWNGSSLDSAGDWESDAEIVELVRRLAPRRVSVEEGLSDLRIFVGSLSGDRSRRLALAFRGLLEETDRERTALIERLKQIGHRQRELAELVVRLGTELSSVPPDATGEAAAKRVDLQQRYDFTVRNFEEIQRTLQYACQAPVELDARLGAWARALQEAGAG
jgi:hypothetical protein